MKKTHRHDWHKIPSEEIVRLLEVNLSLGLGEQEVDRRQKVFGPNSVTARSGVPLWYKFLEQFNQPLVYILIAAVGVTAFLGEWVDSSVILIVVIINAIFGFIQESKAEKAIEMLAKMIVTETTVRREGRKLRIPSNQLVPGDVVLLQAGDRVPADLRLFHVHNLHADESALTGESLPIPKHADIVALDTILSERKNIVYMGTLITSGEAEGVVWAIGDQTEIGRISNLISSAIESTTPLMKKIADFSKWVLWVIIALAVVTFTIGVFRGEKPVEMFMTAVALAVGAIPEGLPAAVTIVLAISMSRMAKRQVIIRKLPAVETLGSTTVICSDKTGTLTENQMTVQEVYAGGKTYHVTGTGYEPKGDIYLDRNIIRVSEHPALSELLLAGVLCNESQIISHEGRVHIVGDPTEAALIVVAEKGGLIRLDTHRHSPRIDMIPFDSEYMFRATLHETHQGRTIYKVGALERLLERCTDMLGEDNHLTSLDREAIQRAAEAMAMRGLRVLGLARRHVGKGHAKLEHAHIEKGLSFLGLQGMIDPPRLAVIASVRECQQAGILVKMITGDHLVTAREIARQIGLTGQEEAGKLLVLTGHQLEGISDEELPRVAERVAVFARIVPEQKLRLVKALQERGHVVAMTGDGVNDAPALKQANIGVAMGISGTDVAKGAASMILIDDNFSSIVAAVEEGRKVFDNLTKFIVWIIPTNLGEALILLGSVVLGLPLPLLPLQLLWINFTDTLLGLSLTFELKGHDLMSEPPRPPQQPILTFPLMMRTGLVSLMMMGGALGLFLWELHVEQAELVIARTVAIHTIVFVQISYLFNCRSLHSSPFAIGFFSNGWAIAGSLIMLGLQLLLTYTPLMNQLFHTAPIQFESWVRIIAVVVISFIVVEVEKWIRLTLWRRGKSTLH